jgi:hypothetical protein
MGFNGSCAGGGQKRPTFSEKFSAASLEISFADLL